jgi:hypothetical protein
MFKQNAKLENADKSFRCYIPAAEAERRVRNKEMVRVSRIKAAQPVYRMIPVAVPSESKDSIATITVSDMRAVAGIQKVNEIWLERLIGFKLIPENTALPAHGYL